MYTIYIKLALFYYFVLIKQKLNLSQNAACCVHSRTSCQVSNSVQSNFTARLLPRTNQRFTPFLALHWLPIAFRVDLKILFITFKALRGSKRKYITELLSPYKTSRPLRSSDRSHLAVPDSTLKIKGDCAVSVTARRLWNNLPRDQGFPNLVLGPPCVCWFSFKPVTIPEF